MALIGYARVSILEEETWRQHDVLQAAGCARIFTDRASGAHEERPELARALDHLREGDTLVVWRLDRLGRSLRDLVDTVRALGERDVAVHSLEEKLDTTRPGGRQVLAFCASLAEFDLDIVRERTALAAVGMREPRPNALAEAVRGLPKAITTTAARRSSTSASEAVVTADIAVPAVDPRPRRSRGRGASRRALLAIPFLVTIVAGALAFHVGRSGAQTAPAKLSQSASNADIELQFPAAWRREEQIAAFSSLDLADPIVLTADQPQGAVVMAGMSHATGPSLLPAALRKRLDRKLSTPAHVRLGGVAVLRHSALGVRGLTRRMTITVAPTSEGVLTVVCLARPADVDAFDVTCERVAQSVRLLRGHTLSLGPTRAYQQALTGLLGPLDAQRRDRRAQLASASSRQDQADAAQRLSVAFAEARANAMGGSLSPREAAAHARIVDTLASARDAYTSVSRAADEGSVDGYDRARESVRGAETALRAAVSALRPLGYIAAPAAASDRGTSARRSAGS